MSTDWGDLYRQHADAVCALAGDLTDDELATTVPGTPEWTVHDVLRHTAGVPADVLAERTDGIPGPEWTQRAVDERRDRSVEELVTEIRSNTEAVVASLGDGGSPAMVWDIATHHADLHEALGKGRPPEHFWAPVAQAMRAKAPAELADVDDYELFRGSFSRRSRNQMDAWGTGLDRESLDGICVFGPRDDDQPVPTG